MTPNVPSPRERSKRVLGRENRLEFYAAIAAWEGETFTTTDLASELNWPSGEVSKELLPLVFGGLVEAGERSGSRPYCK